MGPGVHWVPASMGPRLDSRGRQVLRQHPCAVPGALRWGRGWTAAEGPPGAGWRAETFLASMGPRLDSRGREERWRYGQRHLLASMGPRLDSRGRAGQATVRDVAGRFNGAAAGQPRKGARLFRGAWPGIRFNGAAAGQPRKGRVTGREPTRPRWLQWGRGWTAAEGGRLGCWWSRGIRASMGPRLDSRGRRLNAGLHLTQRDASMGPRLDSRGRCCSIQPPSAVQRLQWGRGWTAAEGAGRGAQNQSI